MAGKKEPSPKGIIFSAPAGKYVKCPHENCGHIGKIITKFHCKTVHNMTTWDVYKQFGHAEVVDLAQGVRMFGSNDHLMNSTEKKEEEEGDE